MFRKFFLASLRVGNYSLLPKSWQFVFYHPFLPAPEIEEGFGKVRPLIEKNITLDPQGKELGHEG